MATNIVLRKARSALVRIRRYIVSARFGASPDQVYRDAFYDGGGFNRTEDTAAAIVSYLYQRFEPTSVLDLGCGMGHYLSHFGARGCRTLGFEGSINGLNRIPDTVTAVQHDLRLALVVNQQFDLVMSIEVAEHLPKKVQSHTCAIAVSTFERTDRLYRCAARAPLATITSTVKIGNSGTRCSRNKDIH